MMIINVSLRRNKHLKNPKFFVVVPSENKNHCRSLKRRVEEARGR